MKKINLTAKTLRSHFNLSRKLSKSLLFIFLLGISFCSYSESVCEGSNITLTNPNPVGTWSSSDNNIATVDNAGVVTGINPGNCNIYYIDGSAVTTTYDIEVIASTGLISGPDSVCIHDDFQYTIDLEGGVWSSSNQTVATIDESGFFEGTGVSGVTTISYTTTCGTTTKVILMYEPNPGTLTLTSPVGTDHQTVNPDYISNDTLYYEPIDTITYQIGGGADSAYLSSGPNSFPPGVTGSYANGVYMITGTPYQLSYSSTSVTFAYAISTTGGYSCNGTGTPIPGNNSNFGDITLSPFCQTTINGETGFTFCGQQYVNISYDITGDPNNVSAPNLPYFLTGSYANNVYTIQGMTPDVPNDEFYNFTIVTEGGNCFSSNLQVNMIIEAFALIQHVSGEPFQNICVGDAIEDISIFTSSYLTSPLFLSINNFNGQVSESYDGTNYILSGTISTAGTYPFTVTYSGMCNYYSLQGEIVVNDYPEIELSMPVIVCMEDLGTFSASPAGGTWSSNSPEIVVNSSGVYNANFVGSSIITYDVASEGCQASQSQTVFVDDCFVFNMISPENSDKQVICEGESIVNIVYELGSSVTGIDMSNSNLPAGLTGLMENGTFTISGTPLEAGDFNYLLVAEGSNIGSGESVSGTLNVTALPVADFSYAIDNGNIIITNNSIPQQVICNWTYGTTTSSNTEPTFVVESNVSTLILEVNNNCGTHTFTQQIETNNLPLLGTDDFKVYPNPFLNRINISSSSAIIDQVQVIDVSGKIILSADVQAMSSEINLEGLQTGNYFVVIYSQEQKVTTKLIKL
jgi:hypothetical protein